MPELAPLTTGTMRPWATSSVPHRAISPAQRRLGATRSPPWPAPTPTSQPRVWVMGAERASAEGRPGIGTGGWRSQAIPVASAFSSSCSRSSGVASGPGPPAHTTIRPSAQEACKSGGPASITAPAGNGWVSAPAPVSDEAAEAGEEAAPGETPAAGPLVAPVTAGAEGKPGDSISSPVSRNSTAASRPRSSARSAMTSSRRSPVRAAALRSP